MCCFHPWGRLARIKNVTDIHVKSFRGFNFLGVRVCARVHVRVCVCARAGYPQRTKHQSRLVDWIVLVVGYLFQLAPVSSSIGEAWRRATAAVLGPAPSDSHLQTSDSKLAIVGKAPLLHSPLEDSVHTWIVKYFYSWVGHPSSRRSTSCDWLKSSHWPKFIWPTQGQLTFPPVISQIFTCVLIITTLPPCD